MDEGALSRTLTKLGSVKVVYPKETMREMGGWFERALAERLPAAWLLYWT